VLTAVPCRRTPGSHLSRRCHPEPAGHTCIPAEPDIAAGGARPLFWSLPSFLLESPVLQSLSACPIPGLFPHPRVHPVDQVQAAGAWGLRAAGLQNHFCQVWTAQGARRWWHGGCCHLRVLAISVQEKESPAALCTSAVVVAIG